MHLNNVLISIKIILYFSVNSQFTVDETMQCEM